MPEWIQQSANPEPENEMADYGLGKRKRADVTYKEQLSENQWLKIIDAGGVTGQVRLGYGDGALLGGKLPEIRGHVL